MKSYGKVGFWLEDVEVSPGVYESKIRERPYVFTVEKDNRNWQSTDQPGSAFGSAQQNDSLVVRNTITILSDLFARQNFTSIKYVVLYGVRLKVTSVKMDYPTLTLEIGGRYHGENAPNSA